MALTLADVRKLARAEYGLEYSTSEDPLFTDPFLNKLVNQAYWWFAGVTLCCYDPDRTESVSNGTAAYALDSVVIKPDVRTFILQTGSTYTRLKCRRYHSLLEERGPLQSVSNATPTDFYLHGGATNANAKKVVLVPTPNAAFTLHYGAWIYPAELTADGDTLALDDPDVFRLIPAVCWKMAEAEASRGRADAPLALWQSRAVQEAREFARIVREALTPDRSPAVGASPLQEALERRVPNIGGGA